MARSARDTTSGADRGPTTIELLRRRDFAIYWWSGLINSPGNWLHNVTASVLMYQLTGSPFMVGVLNFATFIPTLLFSMPAGSLGDRVDKQRMVQVTQLCGGLVAGGLTLMSALGHVTPWVLVAACFLIGTANAVTKPPIQALIPMIVPRGAIARATATNVMQFQFGQIVGPALASTVLLVATPTWGFGINALTFLAPIVGMQLIHARPAQGAARDGGGAVGAAAAADVGGAAAGAEATAAPSKKATSPRLLVEGFRFILRHPVMPMVLVMIVLTNATTEALRTLSPTIAHELLQPEAAGVVIMGYSIGAMCGLVGYGLIERLLPRSRMLLTAFALQALGAVLVALAPNLPLSVVGALPIGIGFSLATPLLSASLQQLSPDEYRSRTMAAFQMAHLGVRPFFSLVAGAIATVANAKVALAVFAVVAAASTVVAHRRQVVTDVDAARSPASSPARS